MWNYLTCFKHSRFVLIFVIRVNGFTILPIGRVVIGRPDRVDSCEARGMWHSDVKFNVLG